MSKDGAIRLGLIYREWMKAEAKKLSQVRTGTKAPYTVIHEMGTRKRISP